ncbi:MAG: hypothetical protein EAZ42_01595 [Verrucomicrobia bacterium]|nr:MAG: hypothetical protein EAZ42_01595 [Verrucomicrobiota bacterium]
MKIYIIDTCRVEAWKNAFPTGGLTEIVFAHEHDSSFPPTFDPVDLVFAHTHEHERGEHPDLTLTNWENEYSHSVQIQGFIKCLRNCPAGSEPYVILYSGGDTKLATRSEWCLAATGKGGPLEGYPSLRVRFYAGVLPPRCDADFLKQVVNQELQVLRTLRDEAGACASTDIAWLNEVVMAARLLMEASGIETEECNRITIVKPPDDLTKLAAEVVKASKSGQNLVSASKALSEKLDFLNTLRP